MMRRLSGAIGVLFAATSVAAGLRVLMGLDLPGYVVLPWLVRYNVVAGLFGVVAGIGVWRAAPWAIAATAVLATAHLRASSPPDRRSAKGCSTALSGPGAASSIIIGP